MKHNIISILIATMATIGTASCADDPSVPAPTDSRPAMNFTFSHPAQARATDTGFESGDQVGLYLTDADNSLAIAGNTVTNERLVYTGNAWVPDKKLYWDEGAYNVYAYYPYIGSVSSVSDLPFEVNADQSSAAGYQASDFLFASASDLTASADPVNLQFSHILSKLTVRLVKGEDYVGELPEKATVRIHNIITSALIDLEAGVATVDSRNVCSSITAMQSGAKTYTAIIVPQRIDNRLPLVEVEFGNASYMFEGRFRFLPGIHHIINLVLEKNAGVGQIEISGSISDWD